MTSSTEAMERDARDDVIELIYEIVGAPKDAPYGDLPGYVRDALRSESVANGLLRTLKLRCGYIINGYGDAKMEAVEMERLINEHFATEPSSTGNEENKDG